MIIMLATRSANAKCRTVVLLFPLFASLVLLNQYGFAQGGLTVTPQQVNMAAPAGAAQPAVQTIFVASTGQDVPFDAAVRYLTPTVGWLSVTPSSATTPSKLTLTADASKLTAGTYVAQVTTTAGTLGGLATVYFTVGTPGSGGSLIVSPTSLTFFDNSGTASTLARSIAVTAAAGIDTPVTYTASASSDGNWLTVSPFPATTPGTVLVSAATANLQPGIYTGSVVLTPDAGNPVFILVALSTAGTTASEFHLALSQTSVRINHQLGTSLPPAQTVDVTFGDTFRQYTASTTDSWIRLSTFLAPPSQSISDVAPGQFRISIDPAGLGTGTYPGTVTVSSEGSAPVQLPVTLTVGDQTALNAVPSSLALSEDPADSQQFVIVTATGTANLAFSASISPGASWLRVIPSSGVARSSGTYLTLSADATGLAAGTYTGTVRLTVPGGSAGLDVPVSLNVSGAADSGTLSVAIDSIDFQGVVGTPNPVNTFTVDSTVPEARHKFTVAASSTEGWLSVDPFLAAAPASVKVTANLTAVPGPGTYNGKIVITSLVSGIAGTIPVTLVLAARGIASDQTSLAFTQSPDGTFPTKTIQITSNVPSTVRVNSTPPWLSVTPASGATPLSLTATVNPAGLPVGTSSGNIQIAGPDNQLTIPVSIEIPPPPGPKVTPDTLDLTYKLGTSGPVTMTLGVESGGGTAAFSAAATTDSGVPWLSVSPASGNTPATITVKVDTSLVVAGKQSGNVTITLADGASTEIPVSLDVAPSTVHVDAVLHGATFAPTPIAPGQIVTIIGTGLGPAAGVSAKPSAAGALPTQLGDTTVTFDGVPAPLMFVRTDQINAIVPYSMFGRLSAHLQVQTPSSLSIPVELKVVDAVPGIFTASGTGTGQAAALNIDMSPNSPINPADRGSVVTVFGTGEGQTNPPGQDGRVVTTDLHHPLLPVSATVGGMPTTATYFGSAPGLVSGVFQANVNIPNEVQSGPVTIQLQVGTATTQANVTVFVR